MCDYTCMCVCMVYVCDSVCVYLYLCILFRHYLLEWYRLEFHTASTKVSWRSTLLLQGLDSRRSYENSGSQRKYGLHYNWIALNCLTLCYSLFYLEQLQTLDIVWTEKERVGQGWAEQKADQNLATLRDGSYLYSFYSMNHKK